MKPKRRETHSERSATKQNKSKVFLTAPEEEKKLKKVFSSRGEKSDRKMFFYDFHFSFRFSLRLEAKASANTYMVLELSSGRDVFTVQ